MIEKQPEYSELSGFDEADSADMAKARKALEFLAEIRENCIDQTQIATSGACEDETRRNFEGHDSFTLPQSIGQYAVLERIGHGGFATVFLASDTKLNRQVALKVLSTAASFSDEARRRFEIEARAAAMLSHPAIVPIFDCNFESHIPHIAYEYCPGPTLAQWLEENHGEVSPERAARLVTRLAEAVQHAHQRGVIHRDLKPSNILVDANIGDAATCVSGKVRITDFGLARQIFSLEQSPTIDGAVLGTPAYMSPEQARGEPVITGGSDIYSLGTILFELLTGQLPFRCDTHVATLRAVENDEPSLPRKIRPAIPADLEAICLKCLSKSVGHRYEDAHQLASDLSAWLNGQPVVARPVTRTQRVGKWFIRNPGLATSISLVVVLVLSALSATTYLWKNSRASLVEAESQNKRALRHISRLDATTDFVLEEYSRILEQHRELDESQHAILKRMLDVQSELVQQEIDSLQVTLATTLKYRKVGDIYRLLGDPDQALRFLDLGIESVDRVDSSHEEYIELQIEKYEMMFSRFLTFNSFSTREDTLASINEAREFLESVQHRLPERQRLELQCGLYRHLSLAYRLANDLEPAMYWLLQTEVLTEEFESRFEGVKNPFAKAERLNSTGRILLAMGDSEQAIRSFRKGLDLINAFPAARSDNSFFSVAHMLHRSLGEACVRQSDSDGAIRHFEHAVRNQKLFVENNANEFGRDGLLFTWVLYVEALRKGGKFIEAFDQAEDALTFAGTLARSPLQAKSVTRIREHLGCLQRDHLNDSVAAEAIFRRAIELGIHDVESLSDSRAHYNNLVRNRWNLAELLAKQQRWDELREVIQNAKNDLQHMSSNESWRGPRRVVTLGVAKLDAKACEEIRDVPGIVAAWNHHTQLVPSGKRFRLDAVKGLCEAGTRLASAGVDASQLHPLIVEATEHLQFLFKSGELQHTDLAVVQTWPQMANDPDLLGIERAIE